ncbi:hypothetical protein JRO89_XS05G0165500 [Xanthoceras sorbifolium]|uniref:Uncharacterized protein n=1 Tax=Xanthoceras sorbifolium TaxID=99658 RepID=A0ABQ8I2D9_9ROSI|nr:hypothetical protein JRO89_XS05G0165500 [Xanthoceras sorbifolium]
MSATATHSFSTTTTSPPPPTQKQQQQMYQNLRPPATTLTPSQGIIYPVASSGRGFIPKPSRPNSNSSSDQTVTVANPGSGGYPPRPTHLVSSYPPPPPRPQLDGNHHHHIFRSSLNQHHPHIPPPVKGIPVSSAHPPKVAPSPSSISDSNGHKALRDKKEETVVIIKDRKVRIPDGASLYALCRSWLSNGFPEETQPQYGDGIKSLPRPLPMPATDVNIMDKKEGEEEEGSEKEEDETSVDHLSSQDLLKRHVKRAKRVRAQLREDRTKRIERFKTRLGLLLPPLVEPPRNDVAAGN